MARFSFPRRAVRRTSGAVLTSFNLLLAAALLAACAASTLPGAATQPRVFFVEPQDGTTVNSPLTVKMGAEQFVVEAAGEIVAGHGHLHIMVDLPCIAAGQIIPKDERHLHFGQGQLEAELELSPGTHRLCLQAADGAHIALEGSGLSQIITVEVR